MKALPPPDWDSSLSDVLDDMNGRPLNVHGLMANHPELLRAWWNFRNYSVRGGDLEQRDCELVILRVAVHMRSWYEWASHVDRGIAAGLEREEIERVPQGATADGWCEHDIALLTAVDELVKRHALSAGTLATLSAHFTSNQVMDVIAIHGMYVILGCMINTWGLELEGEIRDRLPDGITAERFAMVSTSSQVERCEQHSTRSRWQKEGHSSEAAI